MRSPSRVSVAVVMAAWLVATACGNTLARGEGSIDGAAGGAGSGNLADARAGARATGDEQSGTADAMEDAGTGAPRLDTGAELDDGGWIEGVDAQDVGQADADADVCAPLSETCYPHDAACPILAFRWSEQPATWCALGKGALGGVTRWTCGDIGIVETGFSGEYSNWYFFSLDTGALIGTKFSAVGDHGCFGTRGPDCVPDAGAEEYACGPDGAVAVDY